MEEIIDDQDEFAVGLKNAGGTTQSYISVRDDVLIDEIRAIRYAIESIMKRMDEI